MTARLDLSAAELPRRRQRNVRVAAIVVAVLSLVPAGFAYFMAMLMTYGLYSWTDPQLEPGIWIPLVAAGGSLALGPAVMTLGSHRRRWLIVTAAMFGATVVLLSLLTWVRVALS